MTDREMWFLLGGYVIGLLQEPVHAIIGSIIRAASGLFRVREP